jgi:2-polyprenyl-3-methyl-5-hydroxy-6-metoxy-1,4-benzoquinol methylase
MNARPKYLKGKTMNNSTSISARFWDRFADRYAKTPVGNQVLYQKKLEVTQKYFKSRMHVLEFGCGTGSTALVHAPFVKKYEAIDVSPKMIDICNQKLRDQPKANLNFSCLPFELISSAEESYDAILAMSILHLVNDPEEVISKVFKLLKPGGVFVSSTACIAETMPWFKYIVPIGHAMRLLPKVIVFSKKKLERTVLNAGFDIEYRLATHDKKAAHFFVAIKN